MFGRPRVSRCGVDRCHVEGRNQAVGVGEQRCDNAGGAGEASLGKNRFIIKSAIREKLSFEYSRNPAVRCVLGNSNRIRGHR